MNPIRIAAPLLVVTILSATQAAVASTPPHRRYTTADGLPTDTVTALLYDTRGFLWVGTDDGLARFDGDRFELFDDRDGLPEGPINAMIEDSRGVLYVATDGGVARLVDGAGTQCRFESLPISSTRAPGARDLTLGPDASVLAAMDTGLYRLAADSEPPRWEPLPLPSGTLPHPSSCTFVHTDPRGNIWSSCGDRLLRIGPAGRPDTWDLGARLAGPLGSMWLTGMLEDPSGRLWITGSGFLWRLVDDPAPGRDPLARDYSDCPGGTLRLYDMIRRRDGSVWVATANGPAAMREEVPDNGCPLQFLYPGTETSFRFSLAIAEDEAGNLWASESSHGLVRIPAQGFTFYGREDGVPYIDVASIAEGPRGEVVALVGGTLFVLEGDRFQRLDMRLPEGIAVGWGARQRMLFAGDGGFWLGTRHGLLRWSAMDDVRRIERRPPDRVYTTKDGLAIPAVMRIFEDSRANLWIGMEEGAGRQLCRWIRADDALQCLGADDGVPPVRLRSMTEDAEGQVWIAFRDGTLLRWRRGHLERMNDVVGLLPEEINEILADKEGRIWVTAPRRGLYRIDRAAEERPTAVLYGREAGLSSLDQRCLVQDEAGRIYVGTGRGIDRIGPSGGNVHHYAALEGLLDTSLTSAMRARDGTLWFGTADGIARLEPRPDPIPRPPRVYLMGLRIAGESRPVPARGAVRLGDLLLGPGQNNVEIEFTGVGHGLGERLAFETWLEGAEAGWSEPSSRRSISYARLAPGRYRFHVRALSADGVASADAAGLTFQVAAPLWRRWWFVSLAALGAAAIAVAFHRQRTARLVELERVRTRIATDLHDEVGAGLSEIALMGEVWARHEASGDDAPGRIAATSRRLVDSMSDIVWAINPERDHLFSLSQRMRRYATTALRGAGVVLSFRSIEEPQDRALDGDARRELLLAFQEIVTNAVKHARCGKLDVRLEVQGAELLLKVEDDGQGFQQGGVEEGTGHFSLRRRAARLGGTCEIRSSPGSGTRVTLRVPLERRRRGSADSPP